MIPMLDTALAATLPAELVSRPQWVAWRGEPPLKAGDKARKIPYNARSGQGLARTNDPDTWATFQELARFLGNHGGEGYGRGFVFTDDDPLVGVDLDKCRDPETDEIEAWALGIVEELNSYTEISPSGTGIHIIVKGTLPPAGRHAGPVEMYSTLRYFTVTAEFIDGPDAPRAIAAPGAALLAVHGRYFKHPADVPARQPAGALRPSDAELIGRAGAAKNGEKFRALWSGSKLGYQSDSEADLALCSHLIFWTSGDLGWADGLFRQSGLMRDKWTERHAGDGRTYGQITLGKALAQARQLLAAAATDHLRPLKEDDPRLHRYGGIEI